MSIRYALLALAIFASGTDAACTACTYGTAGPCEHTATGLCFPYPGPARACDRGLRDCTGNTAALTITGCNNCTTGTGPCYHAGTCTAYNQGTRACPSPSFECTTRHVNIPDTFQLLFNGDVSTDPVSTYYQLRAEQGNIIETLSGYAAGDCLTRCGNNELCTAVVITNIGDCTLLRSHNTADRTTSRVLTYSLQKRDPTWQSTSTMEPPAVVSTDEPRYPSTSTVAPDTLSTVEPYTVSTMEPPASGPAQTSSTPVPTTSTTQSVTVSTPEPVFSTIPSTSASLSSIASPTEITTGATPISTTIHNPEFEGHVVNHEKTEKPLGGKDKRLVLAIVCGVAGFLLLVMAVFTRRAMDEGSTNLRKLPPTLPTVDNNMFLAREGKPPFWRRTPSPEQDDADPFRPASELAREEEGDYYVVQDDEGSAAAAPMYEDEVPNVIVNPQSTVYASSPAQSDAMESSRVEYPQYFKPDLIRPPSVSTPDRSMLDNAAGFKGDDGVVDFGAMREASELASTSPDHW